jgi:uncharacterized protein
MFTKTILVALGWISLFLGFIGIFLPLLPTTPFVLLAAFLFSKGSKRTHDWLLSQPTLGPMIREWNAHRVIRRRAKLLATIFIVPTFAYTLIFVMVPLWIKAIVLITGMSILTFIWVQKELPSGADKNV